MSPYGAPASAHPFLYFLKKKVAPRTVEHWVPERFLGTRMFQGVCKWKVKWRGHDKPTWEPGSSFYNELNKDWHEFNQKIGLNFTVEEILATIGWCEVL